MIPVLFKLGPITVYSYGLMMALGFLTADLVIESECRRRGIRSDFGSSLVVWAAVAGIVGSRLYEVIDYFPEYMRNPSAIIFSGSGFVWYGGLIGGMVAAYVVSRRYKLSFLTTADMAAPALVLGQALGRIGCLLSGDGDWGVATSLPWGMSYPHAIVGWDPSHVLKLDAYGKLSSACQTVADCAQVRVHPTPIYEAILYTAIFFFLWSIRKDNRVEGRLFFLYMMLAGTVRLLVEFIRINPRVFMGLSEAQLIAIAMIIAGAALYIYTSKRAETAMPEPKAASDKARKQAAGA
jgi:phosphatidylglycerol---prolipoprotein diacylglyceryl transferase